MHSPFFQYIFLPQRPARLRTLRPIRRLPIRWRFIVLTTLPLFTFRFIFTDWTRFPASGRAPSFINGAARTSDSGEKTMAIASARHAISVFLMFISLYPPFPIRRTARDPVSAGHYGSPSPVRDGRLVAPK